MQHSMHANCEAAVRSMQGTLYVCAAQQAWQCHAHASLHAHLLSQRRRSIKQQPPRQRAVNNEGQPAAQLCLNRPPHHRIAQLVPVDGWVSCNERLEGAASIVLVDERPPQGVCQRSCESGLATAGLPLEQQQHRLLRWCAGRGGHAPRSACSRSGLQSAAAAAGGWQECSRLAIHTARHCHM